MSTMTSPGYQDQLPVRPSPCAGFGNTCNWSNDRFRLSMLPGMPLPITFSRSHTELAGVALAGSGNIVSTVLLGCMQPSSVTIPMVGSALTLNVLAAILRVKIGVVPCNAFRPGTSLAVLTMTLIGVAYLTQMGSSVVNVMVLS